MIQNIKDRVPTNVLSNNAIRYGIYDEQGKLVRYEYIKREDEPAEEGTPINRALFSNLQGDLYAQDRYNELVVEYGEIAEPILVEKDIMPKNWTKISDTEYHADNGSILTVSSVYSVNTPYKMCDDDESTYWMPANSTVSWAKIEFPSAKKITKMFTRLYSASAGISNAKILGSNDDETWYELYKLTKWQSEPEIIVLQNTDFYKFYKIETTLTSSSRYNIYTWHTYEYYETENYINNLSLPLTSYEVGKIVNIEGSSYGDITSFKKPHLNINNLGAKAINGTIELGKNYSLVYNGESWDMYRDYVIGVYTGDGKESQFINLGFTPSAIIIYPTAISNASYMTLNTTKANQGYVGKVGGIATQFYPQRTFAGSSASAETISIVEKGFEVFYASSDTTYYGCYTNVSDMTYQYIAFK